MVAIQRALFESLNAKQRSNMEQLDRMEKKLSHTEEDLDKKEKVSVMIFPFPAHAHMRV